MVLPLLRSLARAVVIGALVFCLLPKVRLHPLSMGITNNNWSGGIVYRSANGGLTVACDFFTHDSSPYWEGQSHWEDEQVCGDLPVYLHQGLPPRVVQVQTNGTVTELHAPPLWGWLI